MLPMNNFTAANTPRREIMDAAEQVGGCCRVVPAFAS
jgi:hypothetical protein